jgi:hypothetical protein
MKKEKHTFEVSVPDIYFDCKYGVFRKNGTSSFCYCTSKEYAVLIAKALELFFDTHQESAMDIVKKELNSKQGE